MKAATQSVVQEVLALPFAAQSLSSDALDETISVLMRHAFPPWESPNMECWSRFGDKPS